MKKLRLSLLLLLASGVALIVHATAAALPEAGQEFDQKIPWRIEVAIDWTVSRGTIACGDGSARAAGGLLLRVGGRRSLEDERCGADLESDI